MENVHCDRYLAAESFKSMQADLYIAKLKAA